MRSFLHHIRQYFLLGLVAILPIYVTIRVVLALLHYVDQSVAPQIDALVGVHIPGMGILATALIVTLTGFLTSFVFVRNIGKRFDDMLERLPLVRTVYVGVKQVLLPLVGRDEHRAFQEVVLFEWPGDGLWVMGFVVKDHREGEPRPDDEILVFLPTNHLHLGFVIAMRRDRLRPIKMSIEDAIRTQFSLGVAAPPLPLVHRRSLEG